MDTLQNIRSEMMPALESIGIPREVQHPELATFMPKPLFGDIRTRSSPWTRGRTPARIRRPRH